VHAHRHPSGRSTGTAHGSLVAAVGLVVCVLLAALTTAPPPARAGTEGREALVKAAFLYHFLEFVDWPDSVYAQYHGDEFGLYSQRLVRTRQYKFVYNGPDRNELYDLQADPHELRNLVDHPQYETVRSEMARRLTEWMDVVDDSLRKWVPETLP